MKFIIIWIYVVYRMHISLRIWITFNIAKMAWMSFSGDVVKSECRYVMAYLGSEWFASFLLLCGAGISLVVYLFFAPYFDNNSAASISSDAFAKRA